MRQGNLGSRTKLWLVGAVALALLLYGAVAEAGRGRAQGGPNAGTCDEGTLVCHVNNGNGLVTPICDDGTGGHDPGDHGGDFLPTAGRCDLCADAGTRFEDLGATVFDCDTGLEWEKKTGTVGTPVFCPNSATCPDPSDVNNRYQSSSSGAAPDGGAFTVFLPDVAAALGGSACASPYDCTSNDGDAVSCTTPPPDDCWRLPEIDELKTIVDCSGGAPCVDPIFGPTAPSFTWSATSVGADPFLAWDVHFGFGAVPVDSKVDAFHVRAVRRSP